MSRVPRMECSSTGIDVESAFGVPQREEGSIIMVVGFVGIALQTHHIRDTPGWGVVKRLTVRFPTTLLRSFSIACRVGEGESRAIIHHPCAVHPHQVDCDRLRGDLQPHAALGYWPQLLGRHYPMKVRPPFGHTRAGDQMLR